MDKMEASFGVEGIIGRTEDDEGRQGGGYVIMCDCTIPGLAFALAELGLGARHPPGDIKCARVAVPQRKATIYVIILARVVRGVDGGGGPRARRVGVGRLGTKRNERVGMRDV
jgi:hypothetical protein